MKVVLSTIGKFHTFDLARELHARQVLREIFTGYPNFKLKNERLPAEMVHTFPYMHAFFMGFKYWSLLGTRARREWEYWDRVSFDAYVARRIPPCDLFSGISGSGIATAKVVKGRGGIYVCDRGSSHIAYQDDVLREEHKRWGMPYVPIDPRMKEREFREYELADAITVPSKFTFDSFVARGVPASKMNVVPYGVNLQQFHPVCEPDDAQFNVLFVGGISLRKGIPDLLKAYSGITHPRKSLTLVGTYDPAFIARLQQMNILTPDVKLTGHLPQTGLREIMSRSHVLVLPSVEEGLALVQAQAMACGCPVIGTTNTGAADLFDHGVEGFIVGIRDPAAITAHLQTLIDDRALLRRMREAALRRVASIGGWNRYGELSWELFSRLVGAQSRR